MRPTQHSSNNRVLGAPAGWDQQELPCSAIALTDAVVDGMPCVRTFWRPTAEELAELNAGVLVALSLIGRAMPPAALGVETTP